MKKFVTALGLATATLLATQGAYANSDNAQKIAVVKKFLNCNFDEKCFGDNGTNETKRFLSKSAIAVLDYERQTTELEVDCGTDIPRCYSSLWTIPAVDWDGKLAKKTMRISVAKNGVVVAKFQINKGYTDTAHFKVIKENGQYKIDNTTQSRDVNPTGWWR